MAREDPKTTIFLTTMIIAWAISQSWTPLYNWFDHKINGTEVPPCERDLVDVLLLNNLVHYSLLIFLSGCLIHGIRKEKLGWMTVWIHFYAPALIAGLAFCIYSGYRFIINLFKHNYYEFTCCDYYFLALTFFIFIYGTEVMEIYKVVEEKEQEKWQKRFDAKYGEKFDKENEGEITTTKKESSGVASP